MSLKRYRCETEGGGNNYRIVYDGDEPIPMYDYPHVDADEAEARITALEAERDVARESLGKVAALAKRGVRSEIGHQRTALFDQIQDIIGRVDNGKR